MSKNKEHLKINLDFLDKKESTKPPVYSHGNVQSNSTSTTSNNIQNGSKYKWKNILIVVGIILFFIWLIASSDDSDSNYSNSTNNSYNVKPTVQNTNNTEEEYIIGEYRCTRYHYNMATSLEPKEKYETLDLEMSLLNNRAKVLDNLEQEINNYSVDEYSAEWRINEYNSMINEYNSSLAKYNSDYEKVDSRIDKYNSQTEKYNNYLENNCTKIK